jgi:hypothetical protein
MRLTLLALLALTGCASVNQMPYSKKNQNPDPSKPIYLMTLTTRNVYKTSYQPELLVVNVEKPDAKSKADRFNFEIDKEGTVETDSPDTGNNYLVRMQLPSDDYDIVGATCLNRGFLTIVSFFVPLHEKLHPIAPGIYYLGHVDATVRERTGDEFKAGPSIPLIDQAVGGASGGTFDVVISDQWDKDEAQFEKTYPALKGANVQKLLMAPFDRDNAQKWWVAH